MTEMFCYKTERQTVKAIYEDRDNTQKQVPVPILCRRGRFIRKNNTIISGHNTIKSAITKSSSYRKGGTL
jgi:hypothetical protein